MKTSFVSIFAFLSLSVGVFSFPAAGEGKHKSDAIGIVTDLLATVQQYTGAINATTASLTSASTAVDNATAAASIQSAVLSITDAVTASTAQVHGLRHGKRSLLERQASAQALAGIVTTLLLDISGALNNVISTLGLTTLLGFAAPLTTALSNLLLALAVVVNNLLAIVQQLVDGLLIGLSAALRGLVL
ncbi:MAG: hypothetical protein M1830_003093 [Pleopsidium flavum]|nr:MAG: hypothetical protein M1830_003093 [Pleopsidium flavum]